MEEYPVLYTDGASIGNPGPGAYATLIFIENKKILLSHSYRKTTNNRMELKAVIEGLNFCLNNNIPSIKIYTDSQLIYKAITDGWIERWIRNGWKTSNKKLVLNQDLWLKLHFFLNKLQFEIFWIESHSGNEFNELVDRIAKHNAYNSSIQDIDCGYEFSHSNLDLFK
ncbi:MAG: ribonuclease H family protein [Candidatus Kapaibacteriales bacterium]